MVIQDIQSSITSVAVVIGRNVDVIRDRPAVARWLDDHAAEPVAMLDGQYCSTQPGAAWLAFCLTIDNHDAPTFSNRKPR